MNTPDPMTVILNHVSQTLPDSLSQRVEVLNAVNFMMVDSHPAKGSVKEMLRNIEAMRNFEKHLQLQFASIVKGTQS